MEKLNLEEMMHLVEHIDDWSMSTKNLIGPTQYTGTIEGLDITITKYPKKFYRKEKHTILVKPEGKGVFGETVGFYKGKCEKLNPYFDDNIWLHSMRQSDERKKTAEYIKGQEEKSDLLNKTRTLIDNNKEVEEPRKDLPKDLDITELISLAKRTDDWSPRFRIFTPCYDGKIDDIKLKVDSKWIGFFSRDYQILATSKEDGREVILGSFFGSNSDLKELYKNRIPGYLAEKNADEKEPSLKDARMNIDEKDEVLIEQKE